MAGGPEPALSRRSALKGSRPFCGSFMPIPWADNCLRGRFQRASSRPASSASEKRSSLTDARSSILSHAAAGLSAALPSHDIIYTLNRHDDMFHVEHWDKTDERLYFRSSIRRAQRPLELHARCWRSVGPFVYSYQEDGQWWEGFELWVGVGGNVPVIDAHHRRVF